MIRESSGPGLRGSPSSAVAQRSSGGLAANKPGPTCGSGTGVTCTGQERGPVELAHLWTHRKVLPCAETILSSGLALSTRDGKLRILNMMKSLAKKAKQNKTKTLSE